MKTQYWCVSHKGHPAALALADRHYSRRTIGSPQFCRPGRNLVFLTPDAKAVWVTNSSLYRKDGWDAWECTIFRNEGPIRSSLLIEEAQRLSQSIWGWPPKQGLITYVNAKKIRSEIPGYCFRRAHWKGVGFSKNGLVRLQAPPCAEEKMDTYSGLWAPWFVGV